MSESESRAPGAKAKLGDTLSWIATNLVLFAVVWVVFMLVTGLLEWFLFGSRGDPKRTFDDQTGDVLAGLLLVGAALFLGSVLYLALLLVVGRRRPRLQRRVIALVLSPTVGIIIWLWGPFSLGTLIYGLGFPVLCGVFVRFPNGDMPGHLVLTVPEQREETEPANGDKGVGSSPGNGTDSPRGG